MNDNASASTRLSNPETPLVDSSDNSVTHSTCTRLSLLLVAVTVAISLASLSIILIVRANTAGYSISGQFELTALNASFRVLWDPKSNRASESNSYEPNYIYNIRFDKNYINSAFYFKNNKDQKCPNQTVPTKGNLPDEYWSSTTCTPTTLCGGDTQCDGLWNGQRWSGEWSSGGGAVRVSDNKQNNTRIAGGALRSC